MIKKKMGILLILSLIMIISISAISAADTNDTLLGEVSDTSIATTAVALEDNATSLYMSEAGNDIDEISVDDSRDENHKVGVASSSSDDVLSATNEDLLKSSENNFLYNGNWYKDLDDAFDDADDEPGSKTIYVWRGTYKYTDDSDDFSITLSDEGVSITLQPYDSTHTVIFDAEDEDWFFKVTNNNVRLTICDITFKNGNANEGNLEVEDGAQLNLYRCKFESNKAYANIIETLWGLGGAINVDEGSLFAEDCQFINNWAGRYGGAICVEDAGSVTLNNCYFEGNTKYYDDNKVANDFDNYDEDKPGAIEWSFDNCLFVGSGSLGIEVDAPEKSVTITPNINDDANLVVLYKDGSYYDEAAWASGHYVTFKGHYGTGLDAGTYTVYMMKDSEKRYEYSGNTFTIIEPNFILYDGNLNYVNVFETLSPAVNAISSGGTGVIAVKGGTYTGSGNRNVQINNKEVTIMPKSDEDSVTFSGNRSYGFSGYIAPDNFLVVGSNSKLTIEDITITGYFDDSALKFTANSEGNITNCEFNNIKHANDQPGNPIKALNSNLVLDGSTFESNSKIILENTVANIDDCTFTSNHGINGGAIYADSSSYLTVTLSEFNLNGANTEGGAIYATNLELQGNKFIGNSANLGGAIYITSQSDSLINMTNCVFDSNSATKYRNIYSESLTRKFNFESNEYDLDLKISLNDSSYGDDNILNGVFDWGSNLNNTYTLLIGFVDEENIFGDMLTIVDNKFSINLGVLPSGTHEFVMAGMYTQEDSNDYFWQQDYYNDLYGNEFYLSGPVYAKIGVEKAKINLTLEVNNVLIPEIPVLNVYADWDLNYTIIIQNKYYPVEVVNGKGSIQLTGLDLGNYTVVAIRDTDDNFELAMNFTTFSIAKTYSNFLVLSTNVEYDTLNEAVANSNDDDTIYIKKGTYSNTGIVISNKTLDIIALEGAVFDAQGGDANFIIVNENAAVDICGVTFRGLHNRNTNYGAIVNHGYLSLYACNFTDNKITKTSFAENGGAAIFSDGYSLEIDNCTFINNVAPLKVSTAAVTSLGHDEISITDSKFINNTAREGGALHFKNIVQFEQAITSCDFEQNTAVKGSAIYVGNNSRYLTVILSNFNKNDIKNSLGENAQLEGGVIYVNANTTEVVLDIDLSNFENNSNSKVDGGVICLDGISKAYIGSSIFTNNSGKVGSVILIKNPYDKKLTLFADDSNFIGNHAETGAIATSPKVTAFFDECIFANNTGENRHIYSKGFTVVHDSVLDVKDAKLNALSVQYGEKSTISGTADIGTNIYAAANLTVAGENILSEIKNNNFTYETGILSHGKYYAVLNAIVDNNNNTYLMDSITQIFRVNNVAIEFDVSVDNITYGETLKVVESLPSNATGTLNYQLNGKYYTKEEIESLLLDAGNYTLVAVYDHDDFAFTSSIVNFVVYKANPTISVADVEVAYNDTIIVNIQTNVPSIYIIEIEDFKNAYYVNGSRAVEIEKTFNPGNYTIKVTSQERVNYISNYTEATLKVNKNLPVFMLSVSNKGAGSDDALIEVSAPDNAVGNIKYTVSDSNKNIVYSTIQSCRDDLIIPDLDDGTYEINGVFEGDDLYYSTDNIQMTSLSIKKSAINLNENIPSSAENNDLEEDEGRFIYQYDEDDDYSYFDTLEDAVDEAVLYGAGIITVRGGTYSVSSMDIEGEVELTIRAYGDEEVIFDCGGEYYFMLLTYETEVEPIATPPFFETYQTDGPTVTLENITVINGVATYGGAIDLEAGTLTLTNCNFRNNAATEGGAIYIGQSDAENDAMLIALNTTFINNYAESEGGAIYIADDNWDGQTTSASFYLCTFLENYQGEDDDRVRNYFAGGKANEIVRQYCIFNGNGTIYSLAIDKINQTVYVNGTSNDAFDSVVLLYFDAAPLYAINNNGSRDFSITFEDVMGGNYTVGVMNNHDFNTYIFDVKFEMKVPNFIISEDEVYENLTDAIDAVVENGVIYANVNYYYEDNMEIDISKSFTLKNFRDDGVVFDGNSTLWFFTIAEGCTVVFDGISFTDGAVKTHASIENYGTLIIRNCTFESFETIAIIYNSGLLNILNSTYSLNFVDNAIVLNEKNLVIDTVEFSSNIVNISSVVYNNGASEIISSNFTDNYNSGNGGAIYNKNSLSIKDTVFTENEGYNGGAVYNEGTLEVLNSTFEDNTANGYGGAIYNGNEANIFNSTFTGSSSELDGGAIYNNNTMAVDNSTFVGNTATGKGGAIYNNKTLEVTKSFFGINFADEFANIYNAGDIQFSGNTFDFYDVILYIPDGEYGIPTTITGTLNPEFNMDIQVVLPGFVNNNDATVTISEGVFEYTTDILPKGIYDVKLDEIIYDVYGNIYYGELISDRLIINKANVYINLTVNDIVLKNTDQASPVLKISASKDGLIRILFNNKFSQVNITGGQATLTLDAVGEGNYSIFVVREGDENYNDAVNTTTFKVTEYMGNFIVNSTGGKYDNLSAAIQNSADEDIIYVMEGNYSGADNLGLTISGKKLTIISLGDVVFDANSTGLSFLTVDETSDVTISDIVITGFNSNQNMVIRNNGNLTVEGVTIFNNTLDGSDKSFIYNAGNLTIVESEFYDNSLFSANFIYSSRSSSIIVNDSTFENNTISRACIMVINHANSAKIISNVFTVNKIIHELFNIIFVYNSEDVLISSEFYNNALDGEIIYATNNNNLLVNTSIFTGNEASQIISSENNDQITISESIFTDNTVKNVVLSKDKNLSVLESVFTTNTLSENGALNIASEMNASVNGSVFVNNKADEYRNIYAQTSNLNITNSVFDAINVDYTVYDIDYGQTETIEGTVDIGTNFEFGVNLDINSNTYSVNVTDSKFTYNTGIINGGDYNVVLNAKDNNSNYFVFDKITKMFTVNRIDPGLSVSIANITQGEKLKVNSTINKTAKGKVVYGFEGNTYNKTQIENLTLTSGNYLVTAVYRGDKNYLPATVIVGVEVYKITPNITVSDVAVNYGEDIKVNVSVDVADYYTVFIGNESVSLYVEDNATFIFSSVNFKPADYEIMVYKFETDDYNEAYAYANLTVNKAVGLFNLSDALINYTQNATVSVKVPVNASGNITYKVYNDDDELVYSISQSCLEELVVPNLTVGNYTVTGAFEGDAYYTNDSIVNSSIIVVNAKKVNLNITVSNITYGENATVAVEADVDGEYLVYVNKGPFVVTVINGTGNVSVPNLNVGSYAVNATSVDGNYSAFNETAFNVTTKPVSVDVSIEEIIYGEDAVVIVYGEFDGEYYVEIYDQKYPVNVVGGKGNTTISDLAAGIHEIVAGFVGNETHAANSTAANLTVLKATSDVIIEVNGTYYVDDDIVINVTGINSTGAIGVKINGKEYNLTGNNITIPKGLANGTYVIDVVLDGDENYTGSTRNATFAVNKLTPEIIVFNVTIMDGKNAVINITGPEDRTGQLVVNVGGVDYAINMTNGNATLTVKDLPIKNSTVAVRYLENDKYVEASAAGWVNVFSKYSSEIIIDVNEDYNVDDTVVIAVSPVNSTGNVTVTINGKIYKLDVDNKITLDKVVNGTYEIITVLDGDEDHYGSNATATFEVNKLAPSISTTNVTITVGKDAIITVNGPKDRTGQIIIEIDGSKYVADMKNGVSEISIKKLDVGEYPVEVTYLENDKYVNEIADATITVKAKTDSSDLMNVTVDIPANSTNGTVTVELPENATGNVTVVIDGKEHTVTNITNGTAIITIDNILPGNHTIDVIYSGDDNYTDTSNINDVTVDKLAKYSIKATSKDITEGQTETVDIELDIDVDSVVVKIDDIKYYIELTNGKGSIDVKDLATGSYTAVVTYTGDDKYASKSNSTSFTVKAKDDPSMSIDIDEDNKVITVELPKDATGNVTVVIGGEEQTVPIENGKAVVSIDDLAPGNYTVEAAYSGDDKYAPAKANATVEIPEVAPKDANLTANAQNTTITVTVAENATGYILVNVNGTGYFAHIEHGQATVEVIGLDEGTYDAVVTYGGDDNYAPANATVAVTVPPVPKNETGVDPKANITSTEDAIIMELPKDATGYMLVDLDGTGYYVPVEKGSATLKLPELTPGKHTASVTYTGDKKYTSANETLTIEVPAPEETIISEDLTKVEKAPQRFAATFLDENGNPLANATVTFDVNGAVYTRTTNANGSASIAINLIAGNYTITLTNPATGEVKTNNINVLSRFVEDYDLVKYFRNDTQYILKVLDDEGNPAKAGEIITYNIHGVFYNRTTNATGHVKLNINLEPGDYIITAEYKGCKVAHNITVLPVLTATDFTKKFGEPGAFEVKLVDGQGKPYKSQAIMFNINGVFYSRTTNADGVAKLNINLQPGEYIITSAYGYASISNKITVTA